jgi:GNAT superfamily N-acetyltransferase
VAGEFEFDDHPDRVDVDTVWMYLSSHAYWGRWRTRADVERQVAGAWRLVGAYSAPSGRMVGFARAVSDGVALAYLADLFVIDEFRGKGIGKGLVREMIDNGPGAGFRWMLHTADAHELYEQFGFTQPDQSYLERPGTNQSIVQV